MSKKTLLSKIGLRLDGRRPNELRRIRCKLGVFTQPDGSAYIEQGLTKVLAAVYGPHQVLLNEFEENYEDNYFLRFAVVDPKHNLMLPL